MKYCGITEIATVFNPEVCVCVYPFSSPVQKTTKKNPFLIRLVRVSVFFSSKPCLADCKRTLDN